MPHTLPGRGRDEVNGFAQISRDVIDRLDGMPATAQAILLQVMLRARWKESTFNGHIVATGCVAISTNQLARAVGIKWQTADAAVSLLTSEGILTRETHGNRTQILCCLEGVTSSETEKNFVRNGEVLRPYGRTLKEEGKKKEKKNPQRRRGKVTYDDLDGPTRARFDVLWENFPRRKGVRAGKQAAAASFAKLSDANQLRALESVGPYAQQCAKTDTFPKDCSTWLNQGGHLEDYSPTKPEENDWQW